MWKHDYLRYMACALVLVSLMGVLPAAAAETGRIAFMSTRDGTWAVYAMNPDASATARLTFGDDRDCERHGRRTVRESAFVSDRDGTAPEIYVMNADGSGADPSDRERGMGRDTGMVSRRRPDRVCVRSRRRWRHLCHERRWNRPDQPDRRRRLGSEIEPAWSPDGSRIAFTSDRDGDAEVFVMNADGTHQAQLTENDEWDGAAAWSPDGSRIAFKSDRDGNDEVYVMNADGAGQTRLTVNPGTDSAPAWSPDGTRIAFESDRDENVDLYVMNADGSGQARLTTDAAYRRDARVVGVTAVEPSPPAVSGVTVPSGPVAVRGPVSATATITDAGNAGRRTAIWAWGDGVTSTGTVAGASVAGTHAYSSVGVYRVTVTVTDNGGGSGTATAPAFVVAYDPSSKYVSGGGWIASPAGAYLADPALTGPAAFGFTAKDLDRFR